MHLCPRLQNPSAEEYIVRIRFHGRKQGSQKGLMYVPHRKIQQARQCLL